MRLRRGIACGVGFMHSGRKDAVEKRRLRLEEVEIQATTDCADLSCRKLIGELKRVCRRLWTWPRRGFDMMFIPET